MRVNQQVSDYLLNFLKMSLNGWYIAIDVTIDAGDRFSNLSAYNDQYTLNDFLNLNGLHLNCLIGPGKFL